MVTQTSSGAGSSGASASTTATSGARRSQPAPSSLPPNARVTGPVPPAVHLLHRESRPAVHGRLLEDAGRLAPHPQRGSEVLARDKLGEGGVQAG